VLFIILRMIWVLAEVGPARKSLTTFFILALGIPMYPVLAALLLALFWLIAGVSVLAVSCFGPAALAFWAFVQFWDLMEDFVSTEKARARRLGRRNATAEDITCWELICGLLIGVLSCCSFGLLSLVLTILKSPLVILSVLLRYVYESCCCWLILVHCRCRPFCSCCAASREIQ
ncbi:unnamed protein product, partial [Symbiodinium pilosum]